MGTFAYCADIQMASFSPYQKLTSIAAMDTKNMEPITGQVVIQELRVFISRTSVVDTARIVPKRGSLWRRVF
jgi:hypothetical protein